MTKSSFPRSRSGRPDRLLGPPFDPARVEDGFRQMGQNRRVARTDRKTRTEQGRPLPPSLFLCRPVACNRNACSRQVAVCLRRGGAVYGCQQGRNVAGVVLVDFGLVAFGNLRLNELFPVPNKPINRTKRFLGCSQNSISVKTRINGFST